MARIKANQNSQQSKPAPAPAPTPKKDEIEEMIRQETRLDEAKTQEIVKPAAIPKEQISQAPAPQMRTPSEEEIEEIIKEIEMLQNNGRFRAELLHQLNHIGESLYSIAELLVILAKNGKVY